MAIAKCRLEAWNPVIGGTETNKWVVAQTPENRNAVISVYVFDKLGNPRNGEVVISNRAKDFSSIAGTFVYTYKDNEGNAVPTNTTQTKSKHRGVLTDFFRDFQFIRLVDEYSNQVLFAGRILSIKEGYDARKGQLLTLKIIDALYELTKHSIRGLSKRLKFYKGSSGQSVTDIVKALVGILYKKEYFHLALMDEVNNDSLHADTSDIIADTIYYPDSTINRYRTNIVTDDTGTSDRNRFVTNAMKLSSDMTIDLTKIKKTGVLGEILSLLQNNPQGSQTTNKSFGWDYFVDPNISYGEHVDFQGKNLDPATKPPPQMFNAFERGKRIYQTNPAEYGLAVKYPAGSSVVTQGHKTTVPASGSPVPQYATKPMSIDFDFSRPKEGLYSSALVKYNDAGMSPDSNTKDDGKGKDREIVMEIIYATEISGAFKYQTLSGSGDTQESTQMAVDDNEAGENAINRPGIFSSEYLNLYEYDASASDNAGSAVSGGVALVRIQYQSDTTLSGATNFGYLLISHVSQLLLNIGLGSNSGKYTLKGRGNGSGTNASNATCVIDLSSQIASQGYPRRVWGIDKQLTISKGAIKNVNALRQEVASKLSRSSLEIIDGVFSMSGAPMYHWDGEVRTITSVTGGQQLSLQNVGVEANGDTPGTAVELWRYGFREGMVIAKMNAGYTALAQTSGGRDVYGYCFGTPLDLSYKVNLIQNDAGNASEVFAAGDKVRFFIPLRAGDTIRVENVVTNVVGNHLIKEITYTEEPHQMTRLKTTGVNEGFGLDKIGFQAALAGFREESDVIMNIPKGHQIAVWTGIFDALDTNTVRWQTVGGTAEVLLADGTTYAVDCATTNSNNTTDASGVDSGSTRFGLATPPAAGDDTIYYIYLDPNKENVPQDKGDNIVRSHHFYTRPSTSPETGSDPVYEQDGDNIIIGWMRAGDTSGSLAEFGVFRDSKPGEGKRNAPTFIHSGSATSALLKKGAQTFVTDLQVVKSEWDDDDAFREVKWHGGEKSDGTQDTVTANIKLADGESRTINYGGDSADNGNGQYVYTANGTDYSSSPISQFGVNNTYYGYIDFAIDVSGTMTLRWTTSSSVAYGDDRMLLCMIVVAPDETSGRSPIIFPMTTKSLSINAVAIAANSITADHVKAGTIGTNHIQGTLDGGKLQISGDTTFASNAYNPSRKVKTFVSGSTSSPPTSENPGDIWINPTNSAIYVAFATGVSSIGASGWVLKNDAQSGVDGKSTVFYQTSTPSAIAAGDVWIHTGTQQIKVATGSGTGNWALRNDAEAINYSLTSIDGGLIKTQRIQLLKGGSTSPALTTTITTQDTTLRKLTSSIGNSEANDTTIAVDAWEDNGSSADDLYIYAGDVIRIDTEDMYILSGNSAGTSFKVIRAYNDTNAAAHSTSPYITKYKYSLTGLTTPHIIMDNRGIVGYSDAFTPEFTLSSEDGKGSFDGGKAIIDCNGMRFYNDATHEASSFMVALSAIGLGINMKGGSNGGGIAFRGTSWDGLLTSGGHEIIRGNIYTTGNGAEGDTTTTDNFFISAIKTNLHLNSATHSIILDGNDGVRILHQTTGSASNNNYGLLFMEVASAYDVAGDNADFIGLRGPGGVIANSTIYILPEIVTGDDEKFLKITSIAGSGSITAPYIATLDWATGSSGGEDNENSFKYISRSGAGSGSNLITAQNDVDTIEFVGGTNISIAFGGTTSSPTITFNATGIGSGTVTSVATSGAITGGTITATGTITHSTNAPYKHIPANGGSGQYLKYSASGTAAWDTITYNEVGAASSGHNHSGTYDNYNYWTLQGDSGSNDNIISTETVDFRGTNGIVTTAEANGLQIDGSNLALSGHTHSSSYAAHNFRTWNISYSDVGFGWGTGSLIASGIADTVYIIAGDGIELKSDISGNNTPALKITATGGHTHNSAAAITTGNIYCYGDLLLEDQQIKGVGGGSYSNVDIQFEGDSDTGIQHGGANVMRFYAGGYRGIEMKKRTSSPLSTIEVGINGNYGSGYSLKVYGDAAKTVGSIYWDDASDERIKTNINSLTGGLDVVHALNPVSFNYTPEWLEAVPSQKNHLMYGFIADEFAEVFPNDVKVGEQDLCKVDGTWQYLNKEDVPGDIEAIMEDIKSINPSALLPYLVTAIKELKARIEVLEGNE